MGGSVEYDYEYDDGNKVPNAEPPGPQWLRNLLGLDYFDDVVFVWLNLEGTQVTDVTPLSGLTSLQRLDLDGTQVGEEAVDQLRSALPKCEILWSAPSNDQ